MAMNGNTLGVAIWTAVQAVGDKEDTEAVWKAIGTEIVNHITTSGVINVTSVTGVTAGAATSGPGTGTIS